jgi:ribosome maturation factor RimP
MNIESEVMELIKEPLQKEGIIIDNISYLKEDNNYFLRIITDKDKDINVDDCVKVTKIIKPILDKANIIEKSYILDVCSKVKGDDKLGC